MHAPLILLLSLAASTISALPSIYLGTIDTCSPSRYSTSYAAWLVSSRPCKAHGPNSGDGSALTLVGAYPISNAGCGIGAFTVGGYENLTFTGCIGPQGPYPTAVLRDGVEELVCAPVRREREKEERFCESEYCAAQGRKGALRTVIRCRKREGEGEGEGCE